jgi:hypothetical protein
MTMRPILAILLLLAVIPSSHAGASKPPPKTPAAQTRAFLDAHGHDIALQDSKRMDKIGIFLSKDLNAVLLAARSEQERLVATHPGDRPGLVEIGFNSGEENAFDSYTVGLTNMLAKNRAAVDVDFVMSAQEGTTRWKDRYEWVLEGRTWKLDDIVYRSDGRPSRRERRLKTLLRPH